MVVCACMAFVGKTHVVCVGKVEVGFAIHDILDAFDVALVVVFLVEHYVFAAVGGTIAVEGLHLY